MTNLLVIQVDTVEEDEVSSIQVFKLFLKN